MADESSTPESTPLQAPPPPAPTLNPHEALDLLGDLEARLGQLRQWQSDNDKHAEQVQQQSQAMAQREASLDERQQTLDQDRAALDQQHEELQQQRGELDDSRQELNQQRQELETSQQQLAGERDQAEQRHQQLDQQQEQLEQRLAELDARHAQLEEQSAELDRRRSELDQTQSELEAQREDLARQQAELEEQRVQVETVREEAAEAQRQAQELADSAAAERETLESDRATLAQDRDHLESERSLFGEQRQALKDRKQELTKAQMDVKIRQEALKAQEESLERMRAQLSDLAAGGGSADSQDTLMPGFIPDFEQATDQPTAAHIDHADRDAQQQELQQRAEQLEQDEARLAEKKQAFRDRVEKSKAALVAEREKVQDDERAVHQLHEELEARQEAFAQQQAEFEAQQATFDQQREELEQRAAELERLRADFDQQTDAAETVLGLAAGSDPAAADFDAAELTQRSDALAERELELVAQRDELSATIEDQRRQIAEERDALQVRADELDDLAARLDQRERELDERAAEYERQREAGEDLPTAAAFDDSEKDQQITQLTEQLHELEERYEQRKAKMMQADAVIKQRRDKVRGYLQQLREHSAQVQAAESKVESGNAQIAGLDKERRNLIEVKRFLESSEKAMVRKWALRSTVGLSALVLLTLLGAAAFSYAVGQKLSVPLWQASMALAFEAEDVLDPAAELATMEDDPAAAAFLAQQQAQREPGEPEPGDSPADPAADSAQSTDWITDFQQIVYSDPVLNEALNQMDQRGVRQFVNAAQLKQHLTQHLNVTGDAARTQLTLTSTDPESVDRVLQSLGQAVAARQMSLDRAAGLHDRVRILQSAKRAGQPLDDQSLQYAGISFGAVLGLGLILGVIFRLALGRSRRIMDDPDATPLLATLDKPTTWSPISSGQID